MCDAINYNYVGKDPTQIFLGIEAVMILMIVLHYRIHFCERINRSSQTVCKIEMFSRISGEGQQGNGMCIQRFLKKRSKIFPSTMRDTPLTYAGNWFAKDLTYKYPKNRSKLEISTYFQAKIEIIKRI